MLFKNITILDENLEIHDNKYVYVNKDKISYIGDSMPQGEFDRVIDG